MGQAQGRELPYDVGEKFTCLSSKSIWSVHAGKKKGSGEPVTVFVFDLVNKSPEEIRLAQSAHLRLKTLRHPNILKYIDGIELSTTIYVVTEEALPLEESIGTTAGSSSFSIAWGLHQIIKAVSFLSNDCSLVHHNVCLCSVFVDEAGEWKLAGVEFMHSHGDTSVPEKLQLLHKYDPPEANKSGATRKAEKWSTDMWGLGCLVWEVFNGPLNQVSSLRSTNKIPKPLVSHYCEMVSANPKSRPNPSDLLDKLREHGGFLATNIVSMALRIEEVQFMEPMQRNDFFNELNSTLDSFPESFAKHKILPQLINAFEFGGAGSSVLAPLFKLGGLLKGEQYQKKIVPCVVKLFSSTDRATRLNLLQQLHHFIDHLLPATVNDQIFPNIASGFNDTVPAVRELTVKATVLLAPKLSSSTLNSQLLKCLAKCQLDEQPSIRTNTNICLGKIAGYLSPATRQKVLVTAFLRGLKDPYPPARIAAIGSMGATHAYYSTSDQSTRILPAICTLTTDKEKEVRDQAFQTIKFFLTKLEKFSEDPHAAAEQEKIEASANSWTGWAVNSLTSKFYKTPQTKATPTSSSAESKGTSAEATRREEVSAKGENSRQKEDGTAATANEPRKANEGTDEKWQDKEWEDFNMGGRDSKEVGWGDEEEVEAKSDSDMEGWGDDGWGEFDSTPRQDAPKPPQQDTPRPPQQKHKPLSSGADFFDDIGTTSSSRTKSKDPFEDFGFSGTKAQKSQKERTPPLLTSASLFGGGKPDGMCVAEIGDEGGWGDWNEDFDPSPSKEDKTAAAGGMKLGNKEATSPSDGWGSSWGSTPKSVETEVMEVGVSKQEMLQKKREERRLKQQEAREKRAARTGLKTSGLGAVKKD